MLKTFAKLGKIASENLYFHKKDRELIKKIKENNRLKQKETRLYSLLATAHVAARVPTCKNGKV